MPCCFRTLSWLWLIDWSPVIAAAFAVRCSNPLILSPAQPVLFPNSVDARSLCFRTTCFCPASSSRCLVIAAHSIPRWLFAPKFDPRAKVSQSSPSLSPFHPRLLTAFPIRSTLLSFRPTTTLHRYTTIPSPLFSLFPRTLQVWHSRRHGAIVPRVNVR